MTVRVLIADDQELVRAGFRKLLDTEDGITVVGEAADGGQAVVYEAIHTSSSHSKASPTGSTNPSSGRA